MPASPGQEGLPAQGARSPRRRALLKGTAVLGAAAGLAALHPDRRSVAAQPADPATSDPTQELKRRILNTAPLVAEAPVYDTTGLITPNRVHFVRTHSNVPRLDAAAYRLRIHGAVHQELTLSLDDLRTFPSKALVAFIECSGNSRSFFTPPASGGRWINGGISVAEWTGVPLHLLLDAAGIDPGTVDVVAEGLDSGKVISAIPVAKALDPDTLVAYAQNGEALTRENGYPVRLLVPGWGGIRSTKWLGRIEAVTQPHQGYYNQRAYMYETPGLDKTPVQTMGVKSFIQRPLAGATLAAGSPAVVAGYAWSGRGMVTGVEVSVNGGEWQAAQLLEPVNRWAWVRWQFRWEAPAAGEVMLRSRATDRAGNVQPETIAWNRYGYGNNAIQTLKVQVS